ncbi:primase-helicase family protein [Aquibium microcysteis]|uniref:primase-helicase family protein n=1 Tax=Aquibium microcysteis TaxID=675281 RepID=UPI00165CF08B|nr:primase-helicase family protein [Aquibium microcysteis]
MARRKKADREDIDRVAASMRSAGHSDVPTGDDLEPDANGFDLDEFNAEFAVVPIGSQAVILWEKPDAPAEERLQLLKPSAFQLLHGNRYTEVRGADGKPKWKTFAEAWLDSRRRRQFNGIEFHPDREKVEGRPGYYNLWRGFSVEPKPGGSYAIFRDHLLTNVCDGDEGNFAWLFGWFAQMVQRPREKPGTAIVLRGGMGAGKTKVGEVFGSLVQSHYFHVDNPRYVVGQFNAFMAACLLLQADEAVFAGDKAAEGHLRGLVTSDKQMIESKGVDPIRVSNFVRLMMTSNEAWVIPAGKDERRFAVFDVNPRCAQNTDYFAEMEAELDAGGREALLHDLLALDLSRVNLREIPKTGALLEQKLRSLDAVEQWWFDRLGDGGPLSRMEAWPEYVECSSLYADYLAHAEKLGIKRRVSSQSFGTQIARLIPDLRRRKQTVPAEDGASTRRPWVYFLPPLEVCREAFDGQVSQGNEWGTDDESAPT